jgi:peptidoglycan/xylan/chitin deacetylase (PgdA/CDA1 family)
MAKSRVGGYAAVRHGSRNVPVVALTFDDGRGPVALRAILAILADAGAQATFFPHADVMARDAEAWRLVVAAGHPVGNHTFSHANLVDLDEAAIRADIVDFRTTADPLLGTPSAPYFRPPYGAWDERVAAIAADEGYRRILLWDVDTRDWSALSPVDLTARALTGREGSIILMHAGPASTVGALPGIITGFRARGFGFVTIPQLLGQDG